MAEKVGSLYYEVSLETGTMIRGQRQVQAQLDKTTGSLDTFEAKLTQITSAVKAYAAATFLVGQSDAYTKLNAQLKLATNGHEQLAAAQASVRRIAQEAQTDLSAIGTLYARVSSATKELGVSQATVGDITRAVSLSMKVSGASAAESSSAMLQLSQSFASGTLRGEEFNSVSEAAPRLMKALADGIGVPIGQLRAMAEAGQLTSEVLASALPKALGDLEQEAKSVQTIGGAFQNLRNEVMLFVGEQASASGAAAVTSQAITTLASNLDLLAAAAYGVAAAKLGQVLIELGLRAAESAKAVIQAVAAQRAAAAAAVAATAAEVERTAAEIAGLVATKQAIAVSREQVVAELQLMQAMQARGLVMTQIGSATTQLAVLGQQQARVTSSLAAAQIAQTAAQTANTAAVSAAGSASALLSRAIGFLGGPIGAVTTLLGLGVTAWMMWGSAAKDSEATATQAVERSTDSIIEELDQQIAKLKERNALAAAGLPGLAKQDSDASKRMATLQSQINDLQAGKGINGGGPLPEVSRIALVQALVKEYGILNGRVQAVNDEREKLEAAGQASKASKWLEKYATDAERVAAEIKKAKAELGDAFTPELEQRIRQKVMPEKKGKAAKPKADKFDDAGYLSDLRRAQASEINVINEAETEKLRVAKKNLDERKINEKTYAEAVTLIVQTAEDDRLALMRKTQEEIDKERKQADAQALEDQKKHAADMQKAMEYGAQLTKAINPVDALRQEYEAKLQLVTQYEQMMALAGVDATTQGEIARTQITNEYELQRRALAEQSFRSQSDANAFLIDSLNSLSSSATSSIMGLIDGTMTAQDAMRNLAGVVLNEAVGALVQVGLQHIKNALISQTTSAAMATAQTAAIATTTTAQVTATGTMAAASVGASAAVATAAAPAAGLMSIATLGEAALLGGVALLGTMALAKSFGGGRQYGGPVSAGTMYRVNETGRPEMFTAGNGQQYMMPTKSGSVTPANQVGGGQAPTIIIQNMGTPQTVQSQSYDQQTNTLRMVVADITNQIATNSGPVFSALRSATNVQGRVA
ncbi:MAG: tape measure protein [Aquabacterium sp.]|uniref:tape measure protein n=1 Tax=Aquabacterium sp. TaxID=1872578 RepID=UPI0027170F0E|nr:tape measure protein [Aquabacterium sp.]MDO9002826.1 tape measure protein [Aquabacterium sp.]